MIINRYLNEVAPQFQLSMIDLCVLWGINNKVKKMLPRGNYERNKRWINQKYAFRNVKRETSKVLLGICKKKVPLFSSVEIETINRCNGECPFCPVNRYTDPRTMKKMDEQLYKKIINELEEIDYSGRLALHSNNEPFLDDRIIKFAKYAREHVPKAYIYMYTNGTLMTLEKFIDIIPFLDRMVIDNYDDDLELHENARAIQDFCRKNYILDKKTEIHVRKVHEILNTRGGLSPNNNNNTLKMSCVLPFKQMIIRPDGKTSLCCNDPYGTNTMADLNRMTLKEAWYSERYELVRKSLRKGRKYINRCRYCDTLPDPKVY